jgi:hypothetical protein
VQVEVTTLYIEFKGQAQDPVFVWEFHTNVKLDKQEQAEVFVEFTLPMPLAIFKHEKHPDEYVIENGSQQVP